MMKKGELNRFLLNHGIEPPNGLSIPIYIFSSKEAKHIWTALKHQLWAINDIKESQLAQRKTKAHRLPVGSIGLFYCSEHHFFTAPFRIMSAPEDREESVIWPGKWHFPFQIKSFGNLEKKIPLTAAKCRWDAFKKSASTSHALNLSGSMAFVESWISKEDWRLICQELCSDGEVIVSEATN